MRDVANPPATPPAAQRRASANRRPPAARRSRRLAPCRTRTTPQASATAPRRPRHHRQLARTLRWHARCRRPSAHAARAGTRPTQRALQPRPPSWPPGARGLGRNARTDAAGTRLAAGAGVLMERARLDGAVDARRQRAELLVGTRSVTGVHRVLKAAEPGLHLRHAAAVLEPLAGGALDALFLRRNVGHAGAYDSDPVPDDLARAAEPSDAEPQETSPTRPPDAFG